MDKYNSEGYPDPTAYEALTNIQREEKAACRPLTYIASPFAGDTEKNSKQARANCRFAVKQNRIPLAPHLLYPQFLNENDQEQRELGLFFASSLLKHCDELWVFGNRISEGMRREITKAKQLRIPITYFDDNCKEVSHD